MFFTVQTSSPSLAQEVVGEVASELGQAHVNVLAVTSSGPQVGLKQCCLR